MALFLPGVGVPLVPLLQALLPSLTEDHARKRYYAWTRRGSFPRLPCVILSNGGCEEHTVVVQKEAHFLEAVKRVCAKDGEAYDRSCCYGGCVL